MRRELHGLKNLEEFAARIGWLTRRVDRRRPGSAPQMADPPRGPWPLAGGAAAPLEFD